MQTERTLALLFASATLSLPGGVLATGPNVIAPIQRTLDDYLARRHDIEGVSAVFLHVDPGDPGPAIEAWSGSDGLRDNAPINGDTLFQIGSNTKHFEAAVALKLEADGKLDINQTLGECGLVLLEHQQHPRGAHHREGVGVVTQRSIRKGVQANWAARHLLLGRSVSRRGAGPRSGRALQECRMPVLPTRAVRAQHSRATDRQGHAAAESVLGGRHWRDRFPTRGTLPSGCVPCLAGESFRNGSWTR